MALTNVYVLRLSGGRKYVGISDDPMKALVMHKEGGVCAWTDRYRPESIMQIQRAISSDKLDHYVIRYMIQYGVENVRGGSWSTVRLTDADHRVIRNRISEERHDCCVQ